MQRTYTDLVERIRPDGDRTQRMQAFVDVVWDAMHDAGVSWIGFYLSNGDSELVLGPRRDKPACSPIGLHGACGQAFTSVQTLVVRDVAELGEGYIACDQRDRSELVIPLFDETGRCWGVLDLDSHDVSAFDEADATGMTELLSLAKLTT